uniref:Uncharacterized protein n=1 Tax=Rhizophagus irregularis (strain DAOM 181602 / DAOM 197198 / MUCL 43194) TaxID=747089 RepID=U9TRJ6_RHIID
MLLVFYAKSQWKVGFLQSLCLYFDENNGGNYNYDDGDNNNDNDNYDGDNNDDGNDDGTNFSGQPLERRFNDCPALVLLRFMEVNEMSSRLMICLPGDDSF